MAEKVEEAEVFNDFRNTLSAKGKKIWDIIIENQSVLIERDFLLISLLIESYEEYYEVKKELKKRRLNKEIENPRIHENPNGTIQTHPYVQQLREIRTDIRGLISQLALSPLSAAKLKILDNTDAEIIADLLKSDR